MTLQLQNEMHISLERLQFAMGIDPYHHHHSQNMHAPIKNTYILYTPAASAIDFFVRFLCGSSGR